MDVETQDQITRAAAQFGMPPQILAALHDHPGGLDVPSSVAKAYGFPGALDPPVKVALTARVLADAFARHQSWEEALSVLRGYGPHDWQTHDHVGGFVDAVLGVAAIRSGKDADPALKQSQQRLSQQGGAVTPPKLPQGPAALEPGEDPQAIEDFARQGKALGMDPGVVAQDFPHASVLANRLLGKQIGLDDFSRVHGMDPAAMLEYYRAQPHPLYPEVTTGDFHDTMQRASIYSIRHQNRMPYQSEVRQLMALGAGPKELNDHFAAEAINRQPQQPVKQSEQGDGD